MPIAGGVAWFKACEPVQAFEPRLTAQLLARWPHRVTEVIGLDEERGWLLLADAGTPISALGNPPETWLAALPLYAELQRGEAGHARDHLAHGVPDLRVETLPARYENLLEHDLPLEQDESKRFRGFAPRFAELCSELATVTIPDTVQHDDLHVANVFLHGKQVRMIDWSDASISHPLRRWSSRSVLTNQLQPANVRPTTRRISGAVEQWTRKHLRSRHAGGEFAHSFAWERA